MPLVGRRPLLTAALALASPRIARAAPPSLTFAGHAGLFQDLYDSAVLAPFEQTHPEAHVFYYAMPSPTQALATLRRQRQQPQIDVVLLDLASARAATQEGLLEPLTPSAFPDLTPTAFFPGIAGPALFSEPLVLLYDPAIGRPPTSWLALWNTPAERQIAIPAPPDPAGIAFTLTAGRLFGNGNDTVAVEGGINAIAGLGRRVISWDPRPDVYNLIADRGARLGIGWNMAAQVMADRRPGRLAAVFPTEGTLSRVTTVNLVKGARRPDAARQLIAHMMSPQAQKAMVERLYLGPMNTRARYAAAALTRTASTKDRADNALAVDWLAAEQMHDFIQTRWRALVPAAG